MIPGFFLNKTPSQGYGVTISKEAGFVKREGNHLTVYIASGFGGHG
jgi:hypothetical protein